MTEFPKFMRNPANAIAAAQKTEGVEGYVFDSAGESQMAIFQCAAAGVSNEHVHDFEEYFTVVQGEYTLIMGAERIIVSAGQEYLIPKHVPHSGEFTAGTRTIHAFGGKRARRASEG